MYITGASRGIGEAIGLKCAKDGANVSFDRIPFNLEKQPSVFKMSFTYFMTKIIGCLERNAVHLLLNLE